MRLLVIVQVTSSPWLNGTATGAASVPVPDATLFPALFDARGADREIGEAERRRVGMRDPLADMVGADRERERTGRPQVPDLINDWLAAYEQVEPCVVVGRVQVFDDGQSP